MTELIAIRKQDIGDKHQRYKMPTLKVVTKNMGQFSKTYIDNIPKVSKALYINPQCLYKYFGWAFNTQGKKINCCCN